MLPLTLSAFTEAYIGRCQTSIFFYIKHLHSNIKPTVARHIYIYICIYIYINIYINIIYIYIDAWEKTIADKKSKKEQ